MFKNYSHRNNFQKSSSRFSKPRNQSSSFSSHNRNFSGGQRQGRKIKTISFNSPDIFIKKASEVTQKSDYVAKNSFSEFDIPQPLKNNLAQKGYTTPTPIQDQTINPILEGRDLIGIANTGTGKTAAFLIPIITKIFKDRSKKAFIIVPTRELATQINSELKSLTRDMQIYSLAVIGGANIKRQIYELRRNPHVVIGTPGRIKDLIEHKTLFLEDYETVVLDEVDLMVDIGFVQDVKYFISLLPTKRQSLFFSATINPKVTQILESFVKNPITVSVKVSSSAENIDQDIVKIISPEKKLDQLHELLIKDGFEKVLVFGRTKHGIEKLHKELTFRGFKVGAIHGNKSQGNRQRTLDSFKQNEIKILLATDVASRGLDIPDVSHVINYELPESYDDYIHRIGRTGRAGKTGRALTFVG